MNNLDLVIEACTIGLDLEFEYAGVGYGILGWYKDGPMAYRKGKTDNDEQIFKDADALLDGYLINGQPLRKLIDDITID